MSTYNDRIQHTLTTGGRSLRVADIPAVQPNVYRLHREVDTAYKAWLRRRGLMDEETYQAQVEQAAKARAIKASRKAAR